MASGNYSVSLSAGGVVIQGSKTRTADGSFGVEATLPVGKAGTLSTRTDANTGVCTLGSNHGITDSDTVDVYWATGRRYGVDVTATDSTTVSIDLGAGNDLPTQGTAVVVTKQVQVNVSIDGDALSLAGVQLYYADQDDTSSGHATFKDAAADVILELDLDANVPIVYDITAGATNVFTGDPITVCYASNGSSTDAATLKICGVVDSTP